MILYLDTSALVKLYVEEPGTQDVGTWIDEASTVVTARIAYAEGRAALARYRRQGALTARLLRSAVRSLDEDWSRCTIVEITDGLVRRAGQLAERHALRGFDAIHLAAALELHGPTRTVAFACFDQRLNEAAHRERLNILVK